MADLRTTADSTRLEAGCVLSASPDSEDIDEGQGWAILLPWGPLSALLLAAAALGVVVQRSAQTLEGLRDATIVLGCLLASLILMLRGVRLWRIRGKGDDVSALSISCGRQR